MVQPTPHDRTYHTPVMVDETVSWLATAQHGWIVDSTFGGGGHSRALLDHYDDIRIIGLDRDPDAVANAFTHDRLTVIGANYRDIGAVLDGPNLPDLVNGILLDLGVSSHQLDVADRGFSYHATGPLDMRMGPDAHRSAADLVNTGHEEELACIFRVYGEERFARRIARAIVANRPFNNTTDLASCIADAVPAPARRAGHPARRTFQALRIAVNDELSAISDFMATGIDSLAVGGRLVVMAYHSLEDRIVKRALIDRSKTCTCPPGLPECACGAVPDFVLVTRKAIKPSEQEIETNPRARSAVMRVAERISA